MTNDTNDQDPRFSDWNARDEDEPKGNGRGLLRLVPSEILAGSLPKPTVRIGTDEKRVNDEVADALRQRPELFVRNSQPCTIVRDERGALRIHQLDAPNIRELASDAVEFLKFEGRKKQWVAAHPTDWCVRALSSRRQWPEWRPLIGIAEAPFLRADGTVCQAQGYDQQSSMYLHLSTEFPAVPENPTQADAEESLVALLEPWCNMPFADDADRFVPIALLLTMLARPAILGPVPLALVDATTPGIGKTLAASVALAIAIGSPPPLATFPGDPAELEKCLGSHAISATPALVWDNIPPSLTFGGDCLDKCLTALDRVSLRILGRSEITELPWRTVMAATGNNISLRGDTARRCYRCRLEATDERPELRSGFLHPELMPWTLAERARLVVAGLTILRAYVAAGRPNQVKPWGSYELWSSLVPSSIVWAGGLDVQTTRDSLTDVADSEMSSLRILVAQWPASEGQRITVASLLERATEQSELMAAIEELCPGHGPVRPKRVSRGLIKMRDRVVDGKRLRTRYDRHAKIYVWWLEPTCGVQRVSAGFAEAPSHEMAVANSLILTGQNPPIPAHTRSLDSEDLEQPDLPWLNQSPSTESLPGGRADPTGEPDSLQAAPQSALERPVDSLPMGKDEHGRCARAGLAACDGTGVTPPAPCPCWIGGVCTWRPKS